MEGNDATEERAERADDDLVDARVRRARREAEEQLVAEPPPWNTVRERVQRQRRLVSTTGVAVVAVVAIVAGVLVTRDDPDARVRAAGPSTTRPALFEPQLIRSSNARSTGDAAAIPAAVDADTAFAVDLFRQLAESEDGNLFLSPHSISVAMSMVLAGADGETRAQLEDALHLTIPEPAFHSAINALDQALTAPRSAGAGENTADPLQLVTANSLWGQAGFPFREEFLDRLAESYDAGMNVVDFEREAEASRVAINAWVAEHTDDKITELIPDEVITEVTRLVLVNAITFKASWVKEFNDAKPGLFTTADGTEVTAPMMSGGSGTYAEGDGWRSVAIPYVGGAHLVVIVPDDLTATEQNLTPELLEAAATGQAPADVTLPKFSITSELDLIPVLRALGVTDAFDPLADLSRIDGRKDLFVSAVVHQATVDVDEQGTEAAAATAAVVSLSSRPPSIVIDKPFLLAIRDDATGAILFTGRVTDPTT